MMSVMINDMGLVLAVLATAEDPGYVRLVAGEVYVQGPVTVHERTVDRAATADEAQVIRQLVDSGYLDVGTGRYWWVVDRRLVEGSRVLATKRGRVSRLRWAALQPVPGWGRG